MKSIKAFYIDYKNLIHNIELYSEHVIENKVIAFPSINCSIKEQKRISLLINNYLNFNPKNYDEFHILYKESHSHVTSSKLNQNDTILIDWHLEHASSSNPQVLATWNMKTFNCDKKSGTTGFVNSEQLLKKLSNKEIEFLKSCKIIESDLNGKPILSWIDEKGMLNNISPRNAIDPHPFSGALNLRVDVLNKQTLHSYNGNKPTDYEVLKFKSIYDKISYEVVENKDNQIWWEWSKGDLLVVDLFSMYHAVKGGFKPGQRVFTGFWSFVN